MFKGICFMKDGSHTEPVSLETPEEALQYCLLQMGIQYEVRIINKDDCTVIRAKNGKIIFPIIKHKEQMASEHGRQ